MKTINDYLAQCQTRVNLALEHYLPAAQVNPSRLHQAMRYSVLNGGKRIRPALIYATGELLNVSTNILDVIACAIEIIHSYSLIHDDLPAMDNDDLRRGKPTCHKAFDEATAILAGDGLQCLAFQILVELQHPALSSQQTIAMIKTLGNACSSNGLVGGQALDLEATGKTITTEQLYDLHHRKTGVLIEACIELCLLAQQDVAATQATALKTFARAIGIAFQIQDDILDIEGNTELLGKHTGQDVYLQKATFPAVLGLEQAKAELQSFHTQALASLQIFTERSTALEMLADYIVKRAN